MTDNIILAFTLTALAGLSTGIGSALAFFAQRTNKAFLSVALGFSAGVMIYVSFVEILSKARDALIVDYGEATAAEIDRETTKIVRGSYQKARRILEERAEALTRVAERPAGGSVSGLRTQTYCLPD